MAKRFDESAEPEWGLYVDEQRRDLTARKSIKVKLPIRQHIKLHALKLFSENNISQTVEVALDLYFDRMRAQELEARQAAGHDVGAAGGAAGGAGMGAVPGSVAGDGAGPGAGVGPGAGAGAGPGVGPGAADGAAPGSGSGAVAIPGARAHQGPAGPSP
jgi:hypothetical protein